MSLKNRFLVYVAVLHVALAALVIPMVVIDRVWLLAVEVFFVGSVLIGFRLVHGLFGSLELLSEGARFLDEQEFTTRFKETGKPELDRLVSLYNRLADDLRDERTRLREQQHFLAQVLEASPSGIVILDFDGRIDMANPAAAHVLGLSPEGARGIRPADIPGPLGMDLAGAATGGARVHTTGAGGKIRIVSGRFTDRGHDRRFLLLEEMTEEVRAAEKAAYEKLIRMVAHEVGNSVAASSSLLQSSLSYSRHIPDADRSDFEDAVGRVPRPALHIEQLCPRSGRGGASSRAAPSALRSGLAAARLVPAAPRHRVEGGCGLGARDRGSAASGPRRSRPDRAGVHQHREERHRGRRCGGRVRVRARAEGSAVAVVIENTSQGIDEEVQTRLFTPFFRPRPMAADSA